MSIIEIFTPAAWLVIRSSLPDICDGIWHNDLAALSTAPLQKCLHHIAGNKGKVIPVLN
jgi:hypothetical protein